jgi:hypothetical protein
MQTTLKIETCHSNDTTVTIGNGTVCLQKVINHWLDTKAVSVSLSVTEIYKEYENNISSVCSKPVHWYVPGVVLN